LSKFKDYYMVLGVPPRAHARAIEEKYWEQAHELHREPTKKAQKRLVVLNEAYETLGTPHKRDVYDRQRAQVVGNGNSHSAGPGFFQVCVNLLGKAFRPD
jgi:curved DNA-binding protein CbpA